MDLSAWISLVGVVVAIVIAGVSVGLYFGAERERVTKLAEQMFKSHDTQTSVSNSGKSRWIWVGAIAIAATIVVPLIKVSQLENELKSFKDSVAGIERSLRNVSRDDGRRGKVTLFKNGAPEGRWSESLFCPVGQVVCGLRQRVEPVKPRSRSVDNTAMNAVGFHCCPLNKSEAD